jgi:N-acetylneuraminate synthase
MIDRTFVIAEAGVNHDGSLDKALALIDAASEAEADAVKFQTFSANRLVTLAAPKAPYQVDRTRAAETQQEMLRRLELSKDDHAKLIEHCQRRGIEFLSTPFDIESLNLLIQEFGRSRIKIGSGDVTNGPLLLEVARSGRQLILSTGMTTLEEVADALAVLAFGYSGSQAHPNQGAFKAAFKDAHCRSTLREKVTLLHCTTEYPAPVQDVNLRAMDTLRSTFGLEVGFSDHTMGIAVAIAAVARGARIIEKHFTLDRTAEGPDHAASLEPKELTAMVAAIREIELALGDGTKLPQPSELPNINIARKSIVAARTIAANERLTSENMTVKRPGTGLSPMRWWALVGRRASRHFALDEAIKP